MAAGRLGLFVMIDGLDGVGKDTLLAGLAEYLMNSGRSVFSLKDYWAKYNAHPIISDIGRNKVITSSEPTYVGVGKSIRDVLIKRSPDRSYSASSVAQAFSLDRLILYKEILLPAMKYNKWVLQSRGVSTSLAYQPIQAQMQGDSLSINDIICLEGNRLALDNVPDLLLIPMVSNIGRLAQRLAARSGKQDDAIFEITTFQEMADRAFKSQEFREIFEKRGTDVRFFNADGTVAENRAAAIKVLESVLSSRGLLS
ncbi:MAG: hypothetical protein HYT16_04220 [DPANN group archaeon]|nr:hypothetical protein [DPANN group archaeon]